MIRKLNIHKKIKHHQEQKIFDFFESCKKIMINKTIYLNYYKKKLILKK